MTDDPLGSAYVGWSADRGAALDRTPQGAGHHKPTGVPRAPGWDDREVAPAVLAFSLAALVLTLTPGADTALVLRMTARDGRPCGLGAVAGVSSGVLLWGTASGAGLSTLVTASPVAYQVLRFGGAAYLAALGVRSLLARRSTPAPNPVPAADPGSRGPDPVPFGDPAPAPDRPSGAARIPARGGFRAGLLTNLLNPKIGVFYAAFLPQFIPRGAPVLAMSVGLTAIHVAIGMAWLSGIVLLVDRARGALARPTVRRRMERLTGAVLLGFGVRLALLAR
jgi:threonine/homoserine/homoserine lactone efflux protein